MNRIIVIAAAAASTMVAACGSPYNQQAQNCDPQNEDCYGRGVGRDNNGNAILAGVVGAGVGYAAGRMSGGHHSYYGNGGYGGQNRTITVNHYHYNTAPPAYSGSSYSRPSYSGSTYSRPSAPTRTMFRSARHK